MRICLCRDDRADGERRSSRAPPPVESRYGMENRHVVWDINSRKKVFSSQKRGVPKQKPVLLSSAAHVASGE